MDESALIMGNSVNKNENSLDRDSAKSDEKLSRMLCKEIKEKKELRGLSDAVVEDCLHDYLKKHSISLKNLKKQDFRIITKQIRSELRFLTGQYQKSLKDRPRLLQEDNFMQLLKTHSSTAERLPFYPLIKEKIKELKIKSILDLGCGLNPLALASPEVFYYASDIKEDELSLIDSFFKKNKINGKTFTLDLRKLSSPLPKTDLCILFKVIDVVDKKDHALSEKIILAVESKYILVSFSTKKLSGKAMNYPQRGWFERLLLRKGLSFEKFSIPNEIFYLIHQAKA